MTAPATNVVPASLGSWLFYETTRAVTAPLLSLVFSFRYHRGKHIPKTGPLLIIANHQSFLDPPIVVCRAKGTCVTPAEKQRGSKL